MSADGFATPPGRRTEGFVVTTNGSGAASGSFMSPFVNPVAGAHINGGTRNQFVRVTATTSGFTVDAFSRATLNVLGIDLLAAGTAAVSGASVHVQVIEAN